MSDKLDLDGGIIYNGKFLSWEQLAEQQGDPRGKLIYTTGWIGWGCKKSTPWIGIYGYSYTPKFDCCFFPVIFFYNENCVLTRFDPAVHVTVDGSYPDGVKE